MTKEEQILLEKRIRKIGESVSNLESIKALLIEFGVEDVLDNEGFDIDSIVSELIDLQLELCVSYLDEEFMKTDSPLALVKKEEDV